MREAPKTKAKVFWSFFFFLKVGGGEGGGGKGKGGRGEGRNHGFQFSMGTEGGVSRHQQSISSDKF